MTMIKYPVKKNPNDHSWKKKSCSVFGEIWRGSVVCHEVLNQNETVNKKKYIVIKCKHCTKICVIGVLLLHDHVRPPPYELNHSEKCYIWKFCLILLILLTWLHLIIIFSDHYNIFKRKTIYCEEVKIDIKSYFAVKSEHF